MLAGGYDQCQSNSLSVAVTSVDGDEWFMLCPLLMCPSEAKLAFENVGQMFLGVYSIYS